MNIVSKRSWHVGLQLDFSAAAMKTLNSTVKTLIFAFALIPVSFKCLRTIAGQKE
jgi:uncharacterized membrane protein